jgi:hypothetical protein
MSPIVVLAGAGVVALAAVGTLAVLIIGIRRGDRRHLASTPHSKSDALARRVLLGVRYPATLSDSANNETEGDK